MNFFHRQKLIPNWNQESLKKIILIVGIGGMGNHMAVSCCRLGVKKIILVDHDVIESSNLNRQILFNKNEIGNKKVNVAKKHLEFLHTINTSIEAIDLDIFKNWNEFVPLIKKVDFILNGLDCPEIKRVAVSSLCLKLNKPMIYAGTDVISGNAGMILYQKPEGHPCYECLQASLASVKSEFHKIFSPINIDKQNSIPIDKITAKEEHPLAASTNYTASIVSNLAINYMVHYLLGWSEIPNRTIIDLYNSTIDTWKLRGVEDCLLCGKSTNK
ncbi:MAG: ThiF family adenylyltransferase [Candidatus Helarchaeota archaeon]|nr:ThiF family adenylyltransferase [Candidatus Helarchaeota archaeon]